MKLLIMMILSITLYSDNNSPAAKEAFEMGNKYYLGDSVKMDSLKAIPYFQKSCKLKFYQACTNLGIIYYYGHGVPQDDTKAKAYFAESCIGKEALGCKYYKGID